MARQPRRTISQKSELTYDLHYFHVNVDQRDIFLHGFMDAEVENGDEPGVDYRMAADLIKNITFLNGFNQEPILIHALTCGGCWNYGMAIYDAIKSSRSTVTVLSYSHARSMSSIFIQAADYRVLMPNCDFMIHEGGMGYDGTNKGFITEAEMAKKLTKVMLDVYVSRCKDGPFFAEQKMSVAKIRSFLQEKMDQKQEWYLSAHEAVSYGFADAVLGDEEFETIADLRKE